MLQYPINVRPENIAIPTTEDVNHTTMASFTFQGDYLSHVLYRCIDCATNQVVYDSASLSPISTEPIAYNGDTVEVGYLSGKGFLTSGHNYVIQFLLAQRTQSGNDNLYDMPCIGGTVASTSPLNSIVILEKNLPIYEWDANNQPTRDSSNVVAVGMVIKIKNETRFIQGYNPATGEVTIASPFSFSVTAGTRYKIFSNYLITPQYYFMCRNAPSIAASIEYSPTIQADRGRGFYCTATYSQQDNVMIKYYVATLQVAPHGTTRRYEIAKTPKIFSQKIAHTFLDAELGVAPWGDEIYGSFPSDVDYRVVFEVVTQDNEVYTASAAMQVVSRDDEFTPAYQSLRVVANKERGCVDITPIPNSGGDLANSILTRIDLTTGEKKRVFGYLMSNITTHDYEVRANGSYEYNLTYYDSQTGEPFSENTGRYQVSANNLDGYTITSLRPIEVAGNYLKNMYDPQESWHFICEIEDTTMTHNYDKQLQVGYGRYPAMTSTDVNYLTGTVTAMLGHLDCATKEFVDDISLVNAWRKFISQPCPFLLKSPKGDVWIVNITDSSTSYQENTQKRPTTFSFSWAECDDMDNAIIYNI